MHASTIISLLTIVASASAATIQKRDGCYKRGLLYSDMTTGDVNEFKISAREEACNKWTNGPGQEAELSRYSTKTHTFKNPSGDGTCIKFSIYNKADGSRKVTFDQCMSSLGIEMNGCVYGSYQWHGDFYYYNDPQTAEHC